MIQSNTAFETSDLGNAARYYLVQHMPDPIRKETRNVGVLVQKGGAFAAQFIGETTPDSGIDKRKIRSFADLRVYRMWVNHWRKQLVKHDVENLLTHLIEESSSSSFKFIPGGEVTDIGTDSANDVASYLFSMLVEGGLTEALQQEAKEEESSAKVFDVLEEMRNLGIMSNTNPHVIRHPVLRKQSIRGTNDYWHLVEFFQRGRDKSYAFDVMNMDTNKRRSVRDHAASLAFTFGDLRAASRDSSNKIDTYVLVSDRNNVRDDEARKYALRVIRDNADIIYESDKRKAMDFVKEREAVAKAA